jgi:outer membrane protein assembly factor BamE
MIPVYTRKPLLTVAAVALLLAGCAQTVERLPILYKPEIRQGTLFTESAVDQLEPGMTPRQVRFLLGPPTLKDPFTEGRWDYVYEVEPRSTDLAAVSRRLTVFFENGRVASVSGTFIDAGHPLFEPTEQARAQ